MRHMKSKATDPWAALDAVMKEPEPVSGNGWFTIYDMAARYGISISGAQHRLKKLMADGRLTVWRGLNSNHRVTCRYRMQSVAAKKKAA